MKTLLIVGGGGFLGAILRFLLALTLFNASSRFPWATLCINVLGCFLIGILNGFVQEKTLPTGLALFLMTGVLGGFTTFSAFGLETVTLISTGRSTIAAIYVILSVLFGILAVYLAQSLVIGR